jgi:hypothetical protein
MGRLSHRHTPNPDLKLTLARSRMLPSDQSDEEFERDYAEASKVQELMNRLLGSKPERLMAIEELDALYGIPFLADVMYRALTNTAWNNLDKRAADKERQRDKIEPTEGE